MRLEMRVIVLRLSDILKERKMSRRELARRAQLNTNTVCKLAQGTPHRLDLQTLERVCAALEVQVGELLVWVAEDQTAEESTEQCAMSTVTPT